jgi:hypothetical protein
VALNEKFKTLADKVDQLQLKNNQLVAENIALQRDCMMATNALDQIIRKLKTMSLASPSEQSQDLELMNVCLGHLSICEQSRKVNIDSGYFEDPIYRQFLNFLPYGLQIPARTSGIAHPAPTPEDERQRKRYCISAPTPASIDGDEGGDSPQLTDADSETGTKSSASGVDDIEMRVAQDLIEEPSFANADGLVQFQDSGDIVFGAGSEHDGSLEEGDMFEMFTNLAEMADESMRGMI